ncbi:MAG: type II toxin-antitoxin system YafQ family toxin [Anaerolineae bacterium]|jgi:mRNA interferase YafQ|nr:type II toxin-antitoxin system YafQ family toxin [Anaerolineae bacterium]MBT7070961.1 type II toxin-antitoxin system YafQ family toxin [Anaerolineae bacterium]MBT7324522.1 type II toxin-antitoxin system YafQ family toxin [Anaerolineae bacterium]
MRELRRTSQFKKDVKRMKKRGKNFALFKEIITGLLGGNELPEKYRDHFLVGQYKGSRECHIEPDWLIIYELTEDDLILIRTGSHSDLFR